MEEKSNGMSRRAFIRSSALGVAGVAIGANAAPLQAAAKKSGLPTTDAGNIYSNWKSPSMPPLPRRLSGQIRALAEEGFSGEWGRGLVNPEWDFHEIFEPGLDPQIQYGRTALSIARNAPLRMFPGELVVGSASLLPAAYHNIPCLNINSISHTTLGFDRVMSIGYKGLRAEIDGRLSRGGLDESGVNLLEGMTMCLDAADIWNRRYIEALREKLAGATEEDAARYEMQIGILSNVPENPPTSFREAVQMLWSMYCFQRLMGNWSGLGRVDQMLGGYLKEDLKKGAITLDEAREWIAHFWVKGTEWIGFPERKIYSGDAQFYQNVILGGIDKNGREVTNEVTYLILDVVEELHISDYPIAVRLGDKTPEKLYRRIAEVQRYGGGIVSVYSENVVIEGLVNFGYPLEEAREYTNDGCWECIIPGKTAFGYRPKDMVPVLTTALDTDEEFSDFESLYAHFHKCLEQDIEKNQSRVVNEYLQKDKPCALISMFVEGCIESGRNYMNRGPKYSISAHHYGGLADVANSLLVIKKLVFEDKYISLKDMKTALDANWQGYEGLRRLIQNRFVFFGNDDAEADAMMVRVFNDYGDILGRKKEYGGVLSPCGISTFGREIDWKDVRKALPEGSRPGDILATNCSPTPGTDRKGPTSAINSFCKLDFQKTPNGATLELKVLPQSVKGDNGVKALVSILKSFREKGGFYLHVDVVDSATLVDAQMHPEKYPNLPVRVAGWSARFTTLCKEWQDMVIQRTQQIC